MSKWDRGARWPGERSCGMSGLCPLCVGESRAVSCPSFSSPMRPKGPGAGVYVCGGRGMSGRGRGHGTAGVQPRFQPPHTVPSRSWKAPHPVPPPELQRGTYQGRHEAERGWQEAVPGQNGIGTGVGAGAGQKGLGWPPQGPPRPPTAPQLLSWAPLTPRCCHTAGEELGSCSRVFYSCWGPQ